MSSIVKIILGVLILFVVMILFLLVSYRYKKSGMKGACNGDCAACRLSHGCDSNEKKQ